MSRTSDRRVPSSTAVKLGNATVIMTLGSGPGCTQIAEASRERN